MMQGKGADSVLLNAFRFGGGQSEHDAATQLRSWAAGREGMDGRELRALLERGKACTRTGVEATDGREGSRRRRRTAQGVTTGRGGAGYQDPRSLSLSACQSCHHQSHPSIINHIPPSNPRTSCGMQPSQMTAPEQSGRLAELVLRPSQTDATVCWGDQPCSLAGGTT